MDNTQTPGRLQFNYKQGWFTSNCQIKITASDNSVFEYSADDISRLSCEFKFRRMCEEMVKSERGEKTSLEDILR